MKKILIAFFCLVYLSSYAQKESIRMMDSTIYYRFIDSLKTNYGTNKTIPKEYELSILVAFSYFPDLRNTKIKFKETKIKTSLNARPTIGSLIFKKKEKRTYIVRINNSQNDSIALLSKAPFNARVGVFGHEFCHFKDYNTRNFSGIMKRLSAYGNDKTKEAFEKEIDTHTINQGLGWQLYDWTYHVLYNANAKKKYIEFKRLIYLEPMEIEELLKK
ncbi:MAG: hypothetical protein ACI8ZX_002770 [Planctomycetota bacterium]|jgi:hypothetical protein